MSRPNLPKKCFSLYFVFLEGDPQLQRELDVRTPT